MWVTIPSSSMVGKEASLMSDPDGLHPVLSWWMSVALLFVLNLWTHCDL